MLFEMAALVSLRGQKKNEDIEILNPLFLLTKIFTSWTV